KQAAQTGNGGTLQARRHRPSPDTTLLGYIFSSLLEGARPPPQDDALLSQEKAAAVLGMKPATLSSWRAKGKGPKFHQVGRSAFYRRQDILDWIDQQAVTPKGTAI